MPNSIVGVEIGPDEQHIDKRWLMAYNAALGEVDEAPHPLFPVCYEWPATRALRERAGLVPLDARLVHAQHDLMLHKQPSIGAVRVFGKVVAAIQRKPGVVVVFRLTTRDARGEPVSTTDFSALYRDVRLDGGERALNTIEDPPKPQSRLEVLGQIEVPATAAHVYTECARIWNPIHTDREYARAAGLPDIILHGTATLAFSVSKIVHALKPEIRRIRCRFSGMVLMPCTLTVLGARHGTAIAFETRGERGEAIIERGWVE